MSAVEPTSRDLETVMSLWVRSLLRRIDALSPDERAALAEWVQAEQRRASGADGPVDPLDATRAR